VFFFRKEYSLVELSFELQVKLVSFFLLNLDVRPVRVRYLLDLVDSRGDRELLRLVEES